MRVSCASIFGFSVSSGLLYVSLLLLIADLLAQWSLPCGRNQVNAPFCSFQICASPLLSICSLVSTRAVVRPIVRSVIRSVIRSVVPSVIHAIVCAVVRAQLVVQSFARHSRRHSSRLCILELMPLQLDLYASFFVFCPLPLLQLLPPLPLCCCTLLRLT